MTFLARVEEVTAMGYELSLAKATLENIHMHITEHIYKIVAMPKDQARQHWIKEVEAQRIKLSRYNVSKRKKPNYTAKILEQWLWERPLGTPADRSLLYKELTANKGYKIEVKPSSTSLKKIVFLFIKNVLSGDKFNT